MAKYRYHQLFGRDPKIRPHLPDTAICSLQTVKSFLAKYNTVYIKPNVGGRGEGVIKAWKLMNGGIAYVIERGAPNYCATPEELYRKLGLANKKRHVIQRGLQLAEYQGRKYDIRLMMIRSPKRVWQYAGMLAKTAGAGSIITNIARGHGNVIEIDTALSASHSYQARRIKDQMLHIAYRCNRMFDRLRYEWQMGYDFAVDTSGKVWLIEANPGNPAHTLFAKLRDKTLYRNIKQACRAYKRANQ